MSVKAYEMPQHSITSIATVDLAAGSFVNLSTAGAIKPTAGGPVIGITRKGGLKGQEIEIMVSGIAMVATTEAIAAGDFVKTNAEGKVVKAVVASGEGASSKAIPADAIGRAVSDATAVNELVSILL